MPAWLGVAQDYLYISFQLALTRCTISAIAALILALATDRKSLKVTFKQAIPLVASGLAFIIMASFYYKAIQNSSTSTAAVILNMAPIIVVIFSTLFWGEQFSLKKGLAVAAAVIGCALVTGIADGMVFAPMGILYAFISCFGYASYSISLRFAAKSGVSATTCTTYTFVVASAIACILSNPVTLVEKAISVPIYITIALASFGFITGFFASFLYSKGMERLPAGIVASVCSIEPLAITLAGVVFLNEKITIFSGIGIVLIVGAVFILSREKK